VLAQIMKQQSAAKWNQTNTTMCQVPFGNSTGAGNLIVVWTTWQDTNTTTFTATVGDSHPLNSYASAVGPTLQSAASTPTSAQIFYAKSIAGGSDTVTVTYSGTVSSASCVIVEYSGLDQNYPLDSVSAGYSYSPGSLLDSGTAAPANANLLVFGGGNWSGGSLIAGTGFTSIQASGGSITEQEVVSGNNTLQRATAIPNPNGNAPGTTGNWVMQMAVFRDASWTVAGGWTPIRPAQVLDATQFPGVDIGDQINHAYASCPAQGCQIRIPGSAVCYNVSTAIMLAANGKPALLTGDGKSSCLNFGGMTSGTAITLDWGQGSPQGYQGGIRDLRILGSCATNACLGSTLVGVSLGPTNGLVLANFVDVTLGGFSSAAGFSVGILNGAQASINSFISSSVLSSKVGISFPYATENFEWYGGAIAQNATGISISGNTADVYFAGVSIDDNTTVGISTSNGKLVCLDCHFENKGLGTSNYLNLTGGFAFFYGGDVLEDRTSGGPYNAFFTGTTAGTILVDGTNFFAGNCNGGGICISQIISATNVTAILTHYVNGATKYIARGVNASGTYFLDEPLNCTTTYCNQTLSFYNFVTNGGLYANALNQSTASSFAGTSACSSSSKVITFAPSTAFNSQPVILVFDETTKGGANLTAKSTTAFTVSCSGASDVFDWEVIGNPD
jgi:hypothetical protein